MVNKTDKELKEAETIKALVENPVKDVLVPFDWKELYALSRLLKTDSKKQSLQKAVRKVFLPNKSITLKIGYFVKKEMPEKKRKELSKEWSSIVKDYRSQYRPKPKPKKLKREPKREPKEESKKVQENKTSGWKNYP